MVPELNVDKLGTFPRENIIMEAQTVNMSLVLRLRLIRGSFFISAKTVRELHEITRKKARCCLKHRAVVLLDRWN